MCKNSCWSNFSYKDRFFEMIFIEDFQLKDFQEIIYNFVVQ